MRRNWLILCLGLLLGAAAYAGFYYAGISRCSEMMHSSTPELTWLKVEFHLSDAEFQRIRALHEAYLAGCAQRCSQIDEENMHLQHLLSNAKEVTPEIESTLQEVARLRAECQRQMLQQCFEVSRTMQPEQGQRYLAWVQQQTIASDTHSQMMHHH